MPPTFLMRAPLHTDGSLGAIYTARRLAWANDLKPTQATYPEMETWEKRRAKADADHPQATRE